MKNVLLPLAFLMPFYACSDKKQVTDASQNVFLTPEVMCGTIQFTDGCGPQTDTLIRFGIALIHHMTYEDAAYTFDKVIEKDPKCFWGYWGKAMTYIHPLWPDVPTAEEMESGWQLSQKAMSLAGNETQKLYGAALASFYERSDKNKAQRLADFQQGWAQATAQLPDDPEAALFNGLFRLGTASPADKTFTVQREVGEMAEKYLATYTDHPGAYHYAIHAYDVPPLADRAIEVARTYGKIAPEIPHALHMPSHIFTRLGYWPESIEWNARSAQAAARLPYNGQVSPHMFHALDYEVYALLQQGNDEAAIAIKKQIDTISTPIYFNAASAYAMAAIPSRIPLENGLWSEAAQLPVPDTSKLTWNKFPQWAALVFYAKGLGAARSGKNTEANEALAQLTALQTQLGNAPQTKYWFDQMEAQKNSISAWILYQSGKKDEGITMMKAAADLEDATVKNPVSPGELLPSRELLGDMYMEAGMLKEALTAYEQCLTGRPNRFRSVFGAGIAAEKMGDLKKATSYYTQLITINGNAPSSRDALAHARKIISPG
jgi:tetratricopeptide (TPR) repeat protein